MVEISVSGLDNATLVEVQGRIDSMNANQFGEGLAAPIEDGQVNIVLDLSGVEYMSSAGLREIVGSLKKAKRNGGDIRIAQPSDRVREVLELAGLDTIVQIFNTQLEAVGSF
ncbi:MAG: STAS domain-containing protein [Anaerolineae bacterium]